MDVDVARELAGLTVRPGASRKNPTAPHGTRSRYTAGCSGPLCRIANTRYVNTQRALVRGTATGPKASGGT